MTLSRTLFTTPHGSAKATPSGYVRDVHVRPAQRGQGHGSALMSEITAHADETGTELTLNARPDLHEWYGKFGFAEDGRDVFGPRLKRSPQM
jgi:ribosomal protein S18 acetylase RimI-like enzyme